jgi:hypothetical protein
MTRAFLFKPGYSATPLLPQPQKKICAPQPSLCTLTSLRSRFFYQYLLTRVVTQYPVDRYPPARPVSGSVNNLVPNDLQSDCIFQTFFGNSALPKSILSARYSRRPPCHTVRTYIISPKPLRSYVHSQANTKPPAPPPSTPTGYIICFCGEFEDQHVTAFTSFLQTNKKQDGKPTLQRLGNVHPKGRRITDLIE